MLRKQTNRFRRYFHFGQPVLHFTQHKTLQFKQGQVLQSAAQRSVALTLSYGLDFFIRV